MKPERLVILSGMSGSGKSAAVKCFEDLGFFFAGIIPRPVTGDILELQYLNNVRIDYDHAQVYSDFAKELLAYIRDRDPIHSVLEPS